VLLLFSRLLLQPVSLSLFARVLPLKEISAERKLVIHSKGWDTFDLASSSCLLFSSSLSMLSGVRLDGGGGGGGIVFIERGTGSDGGGGGGGGGGGTAAEDGAILEREGPVGGGGGGGGPGVIVTVVGVDRSDERVSRTEISIVFLWAEFTYKSIPAYFLVP
jgi:hypothetical protein